MPYTYREIEKRLKKIGYHAVRQGRGSHVIFSDGRTTFPVPRHAGKTISAGVERSIVRLARLTATEFKNLI